MINTMRKQQKKKKKKKKKMGTSAFFMQVSDCVIIHLNMNKFSVALSTLGDTFQSVIPFCTLTTEKTKTNSTCICLGKISILGYKVGKLISFSGLCLNFILYK